MEIIIRLDHSKTLEDQIKAGRDQGLIFLGQTGETLKFMPGPAANIDLKEFLKKEDHNEN